jgi:outer membrane protein assembly factor BamE (lipoprotein component of BamABCDE complex)
MRHAPKLKTIPVTDGYGVTEAELATASSRSSEQVLYALGSPATKTQALF